MRNITQVSGKPYFVLYYSDDDEYYTSDEWFPTEQYAKAAATKAVQDRTVSHAIVCYASFVVRPGAVIIEEVE